MASKAAMEKMDAKLDKKLGDKADKPKSKKGNPFAKGGKKSKKG